MLTAVPLAPYPPTPSERRDHLVAQFREAQLPAVLAMDDLLGILKRTDCEAASVAAVSESARAALDRLWTVAARVADLS